MSETSLCPQEAFRRHRGLQLLALVEGVLPRHGRGRHGAWHISLSKPSEKEQHLLMALVGEQGERRGSGLGGVRQVGRGERGRRTRSGGPQPVCCVGVRGCGGPRVEASTGGRRWGPEGQGPSTRGQGCADGALCAGVVPTQDVLSMLGDIRRSLEEVRAQGGGGRAGRGPIQPPGAVGPPAAAL